MSAALPSRRRAVMWLVPVLIVGAAAFLVVLSGGGDDTASSAGDGTTARPAADGQPSGAPGEDDAAELPDMARREPGDPLAMGEVDAPVALVVYSDYQCPFCALWVNDTQPTIVSDYVEAGIVRMEWRDLNVFGPKSTLAAQAAYAAGLQDGFWEYHDALYADGEPLPESDLTPSRLIDLSGQLGLDTERFATDLTSQEVVEAVQANADEGVALGAFSTPSFLINGQPLTGAQPVEVFERAIEAAHAATTAG